MTGAMPFTGWALDPGTVGFDLAFADYVALSSACGFDYIEVPVAELVEMGPQRLVSICSAHDVRPGIFSCPWTGPPNGSVPDALFQQRMRELPHLLALVVEAGGTGISAFFHGDRSGMSALSPEQLSERAGRLAELADRYGLRMCLELNDTHLLVDASRILRRAQATTGSLPRLLVDTFHLYRAGLGPAWFGTLPADAIGWMHVSGVPFGTPRSVYSGPRTAPFEGEQSTGELLAAAYRAGYRGPLSIEVLPAVVGDLADRRAHVAGLLERARQGLAHVDPVRDVAVGPGLGEHR